MPRRWRPARCSPSARAAGCPPARRSSPGWRSARCRRTRCGWRSTRWRRARRRSRWSQGFIRAAAASDDQYQVARSYLGSGPQATWRPDSSVVVFGSDSELAYTPRQRQHRDGRGQGHRPDRRHAGATRSCRRSSTVKVTFGLERSGGEWRISQVPDTFGTWLSQADLDRLYDPFRIYYVSAGDHRLVPDVRWLPLGTGLATRLARCLLAGVPDYLKGAVRTDIPAGTRLAVDAVTIDSGTAKVDLAATRLGNDPGQRQNLGAQFLATVTQAPGVERVALQLEGADLQMPNGESTRRLACRRWASPRRPTRTSSRCSGWAARWCRSTRTTSVTTASARPPPSRPRPSRRCSPAGPTSRMSRNGREIAGGRRRPGPARALARARTQVQLTSPGTHADPPDLRPRGRAVGGRPQQRRRPGSGRSTRQPTRRDAAKSAPQAVVPPTGWSARTVVSLRLSPDGQRIAVLTHRPRTARTRASTSPEWCVSPTACPPRCRRRCASRRR